MTRDEFIDRYIARSAQPGIKRRKYGFVYEGVRYMALPCTCQSPTCEGWAMIMDMFNAVKAHKQLERLRRSPRSTRSP